MSDEGWWNRPIKKSRLSYKTYVMPDPPPPPRAQWGLKYRTFTFVAQIKGYLMPGRGTQIRDKVLDGLAQFNRGRSYLQRDQRMRDNTFATWQDDYEPINVYIDEIKGSYIYFTISFWDRRTYFDAVSIIMHQLRSYFNWNLFPLAVLKGRGVAGEPLYPPTTPSRRSQKRR